MYVTMVDNFMSGWGLAKGKTNIFIVECDDEDQAETIAANAKDRGEMDNIQIVDDLPVEGENEIHSFRHYDDLGKIWKEES